jgi:hypothetical protein
MFWFLLANGKLYKFAKESFDLCFTRDSGFANAVKGASTLTGLRVWRVTLVQKPQDDFVRDFATAVRKTDLGNSETARLALTTGRE